MTYPKYADPAEHGFFGRVSGCRLEAIRPVVALRFQLPRDPNLFPECRLRSTVEVAIVKTAPIEMI
jgi:hypothetical protein